MTNVWFNQGFSGVRDAVKMIGLAKVNGGEKGASVRLLASHRDANAAVLEVADIGFVEPSIDRSTAAGIADYVDYCLDTCRTHRIDLFVAQRGAIDMAERRDEFARIGTRLAATAPPETLRLVEDKSRFYSAACAAGIPMPWTREIADADGFDAACGELAGLGLDACVKPPHGVFGSGYWRLDPRVSLFRTLMTADRHCIAPAAMREAIVAENGPLRLLVLEHLAGTEWSLDCIAQGGRLVAGVARRKLGRAQRLEVAGPIFAMAARAVAQFELSGLINLQFKAASSEDDDDIRLLEINLRMSGGCLYTRYSGVNLPWWHVALELGLAGEHDIPAPVGGVLVAAIGEAQLVSGTQRVLADA